MKNSFYSCCSTQIVYRQPLRNSLYRSSSNAQIRFLQLTDEEQLTQLQKKVVKFQSLDGEPLNLGPGYFQNTDEIKVVHVLASAQVVSNKQRRSGLYSCSKAY